MKVIIVAGARPNFMKVAPLIKAIDKQNEELKWSDASIEYVLVHTGQHYDIEMSDLFFDEFNIPHPDVNLNVGSASHAVQTANVMIRFEKVCLEMKPDWVIVVGDVNSTVACTLVSTKLGIKVGHVEAGLRSFDRTMPEEINRLVTDALADLLFTPSEDADRNLLNEGIPKSKIKRVGNIMIDTLIAHLDAARKRRAHENFGLMKNRYVFVTLHRPSNVDCEKTLSFIMSQIQNLSKQLPVIFPVHPRTKSCMEIYGLWNKDSSPDLKFHEPLGYLDTLGLVDSSRFVITDSGGLQEETTFLKKPCLTLRSNTERPITITHGTNSLTSLETFERDINNLLNGNLPKGIIPELWDGHTGERIVRILVQQMV